MYLFSCEQPTVHVGNREPIREVLRAGEDLHSSRVLLSGLSSTSLINTVME